MGTKAQALGKQFEEKARAAVATLEKLGDAEWQKVTAAERWTVGVTAHHLAGALEVVAGIVTGIVSGGLASRGDFTRAMLDEMNAQHAKEHAHCTRAETLAFFQQGAAKAFSVVRSLTDDQLAKSGTVFTDAPPMDGRAAHHARSGRSHRRAHGQHTENRGRVTEIARSTRTSRVIKTSREPLYRRLLTLQPWRSGFRRMG
jgi:DinB superfamily